MSTLLVTLVRGLPHGIQPNSNGRIRVTDVGSSWSMDRLRTLLHDGRPVVEVRYRIGEPGGCATLFSREEGEDRRRERRAALRATARHTEASKAAILAALRAGDGVRYSAGQLGGTLSMEIGGERVYASAAGCARSLGAAFDTARLTARLERAGEYSTMVRLRGGYLTRAYGRGWLDRIQQGVDARCAS